MDRSLQSLQAEKPNMRNVSAWRSIWLNMQFTHLPSNSSVAGRPLSKLRWKQKEGDLEVRNSWALVRFCCGDAGWKLQGVSVENDPTHRFSPGLGALLLNCLPSFWLNSEATALLPSAAAVAAAAFILKALDHNETKHYLSPSSNVLKIVHIPHI